MVNVNWFGHAMFLVERKGLKIITDPYSTEIGYSFPDLKASVVTVSHDHFDHNNISAIDDNPMIISDAAPILFGPVSFEGLITDHDDAGGEKRGKNIMFRWQMGEIIFAHMGDYGEAELTSEQKSFLRQADVLMIPVGGVFTIDGEQARKIVSAVSPRVVIPMHYKTPMLNLEIDTIDDFTDNLDNVRHVGKTASIEAEKLPASTEIWVMELS